MSIDPIFDETFYTPPSSPIELDELYTAPSSPVAGSLEIFNQNNHWLRGISHDILMQIASYLPRQSCDFTDTVCEKIDTITFTAQKFLFWIALATKNPFIGTTFQDLQREQLSLLSPNIDRSILLSLPEDQIKYHHSFLKDALSLTPLFSQENPPLTLNNYNKIDRLPHTLLVSINCFIEEKIKQTLKKDLSNKDIIQLFLFALKHNRSDIRETLSAQFFENLNSSENPSDPSAQKFFHELFNGLSQNITPDLVIRGSCKTSHLKILRIFQKKT